MIGGSGMNGAIKRSSPAVDLVGGGAPSYITGAEIPYDLSTASVIGTVADVGKTLMLTSSTEGKSYTLPDATKLKLKQGKLINAIGFRVDPRSKPIRIFNAGTAGTDAILEAFALPGADFSLFSKSIGTAVGDWRARGGGLFHGPVPVTLPFSLDPGVDLGSTMSVSAVTADIIAPNIQLARGNGSSTLYSAVAVPAAGTSIVQYAATVNHTTGAWAWGSPVTVFSSANQWSKPRVIGIGAASFGILAWEATNAKVSARGSTVAGTVITQGTAIVSGAWSVNPSSQVSMIECSLVSDSATSFFWPSAYNDSALGITHFSLAGANLTQDGGAVFAAVTRPVFTK